MAGWGTAATAAAERTTVWIMALANSLSRKDHIKPVTLGAMPRAKFAAMNEMKWLGDWHGYVGVQCICRRTAIRGGIKLQSRGRDRNFKNNCL